MPLDRVVAPQAALVTAPHHHGLLSDLPVLDLNLFLVGSSALHHVLLNLLQHTVVITPRLVDLDAVWLRSIRLLLCPLDAHVHVPNVDVLHRHVHIQLRAIQLGVSIRIQNLVLHARRVHRLVQGFHRVVKLGVLLDA